MAYQVQYYDDEVSPKKWRTAVLKIVEVTTDKEILRAVMNNPAYNPKMITQTDDIKEAEAKKKELIAGGWKARIREVEKEAV